MTTKPDMIIGNQYSILDSLGMVGYEAKFIATGHKYRTYDGRTFYKESSAPYYVFERDRSYKYAAAKPVFENLKFSHFQVERYGDSLEHLFVEFRQPLFSLGDSHSVKPDNFSLEFSTEKGNSGPDGGFVGC